MRDFSSLQEAHMFSIMKPIPAKDVKSPLRKMDVYGHGVMLTSFPEVDSGTYDQMATRFRKTLGIDAAAPGGGDFVFSIKEDE